MKAVGQDRHGSRHGAEHDLDDGDEKIEDENAVQDPDDLGVPVRIAAADQNMWAVGIGHQRSCTLPMMYFFGTKPQWRLSELLLRWSPITK